MDLQAGERILTVLEKEADRVKGLGDLHEQLGDLHEQLGLGLKASRDSISYLRLVADKLEKATAQSETNRQRFTDEVLYASQSLQDTISALTDRLNRALSEQTTLVDTQFEAQKKALSSGLVAIHSQVKGQVVEIDRTVKAELAQTLGCFRAELSNLASAISRSIDLSHRELNQAVATAQTNHAVAIKELGASLRAQSRNGAIALGAVVIANAVGFWWLLTMLQK